MKFVLSSFTDIKFDMFDRRRSGACIEAFCDKKLGGVVQFWLVFGLTLEEAIDGSDTMKNYRKYGVLNVKECIYDFVLTCIKNNTHSVLFIHYRV